MCSSHAPEAGADARCRFCGALLASYATAREDHARAMHPERGPIRHDPREAGADSLTCHLPRWVNPETGDCEHADHEATPCLVCGAPILYGIGHDAGCMAAGECGERLSDPDGFTTQCRETWGVEHSHHDATARQYAAYIEDIRADIAAAGGF